MVAPRTGYVVRMSRGRLSAERLLNKVWLARDDATESRWSVVVDDEREPARERVGVRRFFWEITDTIESR